MLGLVTRGKKTVFKLARKIPVISQRIEHEMKKINETFEQEVIHRNQGNPYITTLPTEGKSHHDIIQQVEQYLSFGKCNEVRHNAYALNREVEIYITNMAVYV